MLPPLGFDTGVCSDDVSGLLLSSSFDRLAFILADVLLEDAGPVLPDAFSGLVVESAARPVAVRIWYAGRSEL